MPPTYISINIIDKNSIFSKNNIKPLKIETKSKQNIEYTGLCNKIISIEKNKAMLEKMIE